MDEKCSPKKIKLFITIIDRGKGEKVVEMFKENNIVYNLIMLGNGTAKSEILDYLGIGETQKDLVLSVVKEEDVVKVMNLLKEKMHLKKPGNGIAFTIPINSIDSAQSLEYICNLINEKKEWNNGNSIKLRFNNYNS